MLNGLNTDLLEIVCIVSFDLWSRHFSQSFAAVYSAELLFSSNDYCSFSDLANAVAFVVLLLTTLNGPKSMTNNEFIVSLFILFIYSLPCPSLCLFYLYCLARANFRKHGKLFLFLVLLKFVWLPGFPRWRCFH